MSHGMGDLLDKEWDVILVGTDCIQAVLAASLARAGKSVLHLDENEYYGGDMVSHPFNAMLEWADDNMMDATQDGGVAAWDCAVTTAAPQPAAGAAAAAAAVAGNADANAELNIAVTDSAPSQLVPVLAATTPRQRTFCVSRVSCAAVDETLVAPRSVKVGDPVVVFAPDPATGAPKPAPPPRRGWGPPPKPPPRPEFCRGTLRALDPDTGMAAVAVRGWEMADGTAPMLHAHADQMAHEKDVDPAVQTGEERAMAAFQALVDKSRNFALDVKPRLLLSRGTAIEALIRSQVSKYMEFKLLEGTFVATPASSADADDAAAAGGRRRSTRGKSAAALRRRKKQEKAAGVAAEAAAQQPAGDEDAGGGGGGGAAAAARAAAEDQAGEGSGAGTDGGGGGGVAAAAATTAPAGAAGAAGGDLSISAVPCSKSDVFANKTLVLKDKLVLMKFLQFCLDFHVEDYEGVALAQQNEALPLGTGRSLKRPQNKRKANYDFAGHADGPFITFLRECVGLSPALVTIAFHAIALASCDIAGSDTNAEVTRAAHVAQAAEGVVARVPAVTTRQGMQMISQYLGSLGRYGTAAYLCPMYGSCELPQAFCRYGAVHGAIYVLRRPVDGLGIDSTRPQNPVVRGVYSEGLFFRGRTVICPPSYVPHLARPRLHVAIARAMFIVRGARQGAAATATTAAAASASSARSSSSRAKSRVAAAAAAAAAAAGPGVLASGRSLCVLPPRAPGVGNPCAVRVLQLDATSQQVPRAGRGEREYFLVHLSTLSAGDRGAAAKAADAVLARAMDVLLHKRNAVADVEVPADVVWSMHYHERIFEAVPRTDVGASDAAGAAGAAAAAEVGAGDPRVPEGLGVAFEGSMLFHIATAKSEEEEAARKAQDRRTGSRRTGTGELASMHYEAAWLTAQRLFHKIAPGAEFFPAQPRGGEAGGGDGGVGGSSFDEGGDWDAVDVQVPAATAAADDSVDSGGRAVAADDEEGEAEGGEVTGGGPTTGQE